MSDKIRNREQELRGIEAALLRAAKQARRIAAQTNTALVYVKDGKIIEEYVTLEQIEREESESRENQAGR